MKSIVFNWTLTLGAVGFACGFFGPMLLSPQSNQGPMLGIFITGPGGAILGAVLGLIVGLLHLADTVERTLLRVAGSMVALVTLYASTPPPELIGRIIDAELAGCMRPVDALPGAVSEWEKSIARVTWAPAREGWQEEATRNAQNDPGVVLTLRIWRERLIYENRKPWNYGKVVPAPWRNTAETKSYYVRASGGGCANYTKVTRDVYFPVSERETENNWPARSVPNFLRLQVLGPVPEKYQDAAD